MNVDSVNQRLLRARYNRKKLTLHLSSLVGRHVENDNNYVDLVDQDGKHRCQNQGLNLHHFPSNCSLSHPSGWA